MNRLFEMFGPDRRFTRAEAIEKLGIDPDDAEQEFGRGVKAEARNHPELCDGYFLVSSFAGGSHLLFTKDLILLWKWFCYKLRRGEFTGSVFRCAEVIRDLGDDQAIEMCHGIKLNLKMGADLAGRISNDYQEGKVV